MKIIGTEENGGMAPASWVKQLANQPSLELQANLIYGKGLNLKSNLLGDANPILTKATITFFTHNDNKDDDTQLNVTLKTKVTLFLSKTIATGNNLGGNMEFGDPSTLGFDLVLVSNSIKLSDLTLPVVDIDIQPNGNDRWIFDYQVALTFDDGNTYSSKSQGLILDQDNRHYGRCVFKLIKFY